MRRLNYLAMGAALALGLATQAHATFIVDTNAKTDGTKLFLTKAKAATSSTGSVVSADDVNISVTGASDFANGYANIKPVKGGTLTDLIFTPVDDTLFDSFSFRGQSLSANVTIALTVTDSLGGTQTFNFSISKANQDFGDLGIISGDGETIKSVELSLPSGFKEAKQFQFDCLVATASCPNNGMGGGGGIPEPATWALMLVGIGGVGSLIRSGRRVASSMV
jgi:hypothetical protein